MAAPLTRHDRAAARSDGFAGMAGPPAPPYAGRMTDSEIHDRISGLVDEEHELRRRVESGELAPEEEQARLSQLEVTLDQCWDLLRQRRARRTAGQDPDDAQARPPVEVEGYRQ